MAGRSGTIGRAVVMQSAVRVLSLFASVFTVAMSTHYLGLERYGLLTAAVVFIGLFQSFTELGMGAVIVRRVANNKGPLNKLIGINLGFSLVFAPVVAVLAIGTAMILHHDNVTLQIAVAIISIGLFLDTISTCYDPVYEVHIRFGAVAFADGASRVGAMVLTWVVSTYDLGLLAMVAVQITPMVVRFITTLLTAPRLEPGGRMRFNRAEVTELIRESLPFTFLLVVAALYWRLDGLLVSVLSTERETGSYGIALQITSAFGFVSTIFCRAVYSTIAEGWATNRQRFRQAVRSSYEFMLLAGAPLAVFGWVMAEGMINLFSTPEFVEAATWTTRLFFVAAGLQYLNALTTQPLFAAGQQRYQVWCSIINGSMNIILNIVLVPKYGAVGTAIAMISSELLGATLATIRLWQLGVPVMRPLFPLRVIPALAAGVVAYWLLDDHLWFVAAALVAGIVYGITILLTRAMTIDVLKQLLKRNRDDDDDDDDDAKTEVIAVVDAEGKTV